MEKGILLKTKEALAKGNPILLEELLTEIGFETKIDVNDLPGSNWFRNHLELEQEKGPRFGHQYSLFPEFEDLTDYIAAYENGFVIRDSRSNIAAYGIIDEIFTQKRIELKSPHHFFYIMPSRDLNVDQLSDNAKNSPGNPALMHKRLNEPTKKMMKFAGAFIFLNLVDASARNYLENKYNLNLNSIIPPIGNIGLDYYKFALSFFIGFYEKKKTTIGSPMPLTKPYSNYGENGLMKYFRHNLK